MAPLFTQGVTMAPGAVEEGSKVAQEVVQALKTQPLSLALIVMNIVFVLTVGIVIYGINKRTITQNEVKDALINKLVEQCKAAQ